MISSTDIDTLRSIARARGDYNEIKRELAAAAWEIITDDVALGFLRVGIPGASENDYYRLIIGYRDKERPPYSLLTFFLFPDSEEHIAAFNSAFYSVADAIKGTLGTPTASGEHRLSFRTWSYAYHRWSLTEGEFTLVQDEFDIQEGMDVTLWIQPVGTPIEESRA